jgi:hypothetical protein
VRMLARIVLSAMLGFGLVACASTLVASPTMPSASVATDPATAVPPSPTLMSSPTVSPSLPSASPAVTVRTLGADFNDMEHLLEWEIMVRGDHRNCLKWTGHDGGHEDLAKLLAKATGVERMIGQRVWLGTLEGAAKSLGSSEVVVPVHGESRAAWIVIHLPPKVGKWSLVGAFEGPAGSLAAISLRREDIPDGATVPAGASVWFADGGTLVSMKCR